MKKQLLLLMMMLLPMVASADDSGKCGNNVTYTYIESTHTLTVLGTGAMTNYTDNNTPWYSYRTEIAKIIIEKGVTSIGGYAFSNCTGLASVTIPKSVSDIGESAFSGCSCLTSVTIPNGVTSISQHTFEGCHSLTSVTIPNSVTSIGEYAFCACSGLTSVLLGNSVTIIQSGAFRGCYGLTTITIPNSVTSIESGAFAYCIGLTSVTLGNSVSSIGYNAFGFCSGLASITIPDCVTSIGQEAFYGCTSLTSVHISDLKAWCSISFDYLSNPVIYAHHLFLNGIEVMDLVIPNSVTSIGNETFWGCTSLTSVTIPNSVTSIGQYAFSECSGLTSVTIPNSVTSIEVGAFLDCYKIENITLPENLHIIKGGTFQGCSSLTTLIIPASVEFIYQEAFANCNALKSVKAKPSTPPFLYDNSFSNYSVPLEVPKGCKEEYQNAQGWKNFTNICESDKGYYNLIYLVDNEEYKSYKIEEGSSITPEPTPVKEGYTFSGWSEIPETMPAHDVTVTGTFSINKYKLAYTVDGEEYKSYEVEYGATITPEADPTKEGYTFSGWSEIPQSMPAHDVSVTGTFSINKYKLTYIVDGAEYKTYEVEYGETIMPEAEPTKEGYTFSGWSEIPETMPAHDVTVTGTFSINKYKLTYTVDGEEYKSYEVEYGATITPEAAPTKEGYTFSGWSEIPETMPAHDVTVTGTFIIN